MFYNYNPKGGEPRKGERPSAKARKKWKGNGKEMKKFIK